MGFGFARCLDTFEVPKKGAFVKQHGFTLIELMITLAVAAILIAIAAPSFSRAMSRQQISGAVSDFTADVALARAEAARQGRQARLCSSADGMACGGAWHNGWLLWVDTNADGALNNGEVVRRHAALARGVTMVEGGGAGDLVYQPNGRPVAARLFTVCVSGEVGRVVNSTVSGPVNAYPTAAPCA